jgi:hypothetical protein
MKAAHRKRPMLTLLTASEVNAWRAERVRLEKREQDARMAVMEFDRLTCTEWVKLLRRKRRKKKRSEDSVNKGARVHPLNR